jgi:hypothetical protein
MLSPGATITVTWGYELHSITLTTRNWRKVKAGKLLRVRGRGYSCCEGRFRDYWAFNEREAGSLLVEYGNNGGVGYIGDLSGAEIEEHDGGAGSPAGPHRDNPTEVWRQVHV